MEVPTPKREAATLAVAVVHDEGLHIDVETPAGEVTLHPRHDPLPPDRGRLIRICVEYFDNNVQYFVDVFNGDTSPSNPPSWPDGGNADNTPTLMPRSELGTHMASDPDTSPRDREMISKAELSDLLAEATGTSAEEIERGAEEFWIAPPEDAEVVDE